MSEPQVKFGDILKSLRKARGWTQAEVAKNAGVSVRTVNRLEGSGKFKVRPDALAKLANALNRPIEEFISLAGIVVSEEKLTSMSGQKASLGEPLAYAQRMLPVAFLDRVLTKMVKRGEPTLLCISVMSDRSIDNPATWPVMSKLLKAGLFIAVTSAYPNGLYITAHSSRITNLSRLYNSIFARAHGLAKQLRNLEPDCARQVAVMRLAGQPETAGITPLRLAFPPIGVTDNRPCLFYYRANKGKDLQEDVELATYIRIGGNRPDHWVIVYPSVGNIDEQERGAETRNNWLEYFSEIVSSWQDSDLTKPWTLDVNDRNYWCMYKEEE